MTTTLYYSLSLHDALPIWLDPVAMAAASDNWSLAWRLVAPHLRSRPGARVLVAARGSIGLYACGEDRKSTRLNSSHVAISYAVFCLKKKKLRKNTYTYMNS